MSGGYKTPASDGELQRVVDEMKRRLAQLEAPDGSQVADALATLTALVDGLLTQINGIFSGYVSAGGSISAGGDINVTGDIYTPHGRATPVVVSYVAAYLDSVGRLGATPSSIKYKQDIAAADTSKEVDALLHAALVRFRYIEAVEQFGKDAETELGGIAEYFDVIGLSDYVFYHEDGSPMGIKYERLTIPLIAVVQSQDKRINALEARLEAAGL